MNNNWLHDFANNVFSFDGEDGILEKILSVLPQEELNHWVVEFGAWDGMHLSNSRNLIENKQYHAVLIEGSKERFSDLAKNYAQNSKVYPIHAFVGFTKENNLDHLLHNTPIPKEFDVISIDIDGNDYHVWEAIEQYKAKIVCIEFNPTIPNEVAFIQEKNMQVQKGNSLLAFDRLSKKIGYELVAVSKWNAFFVLKKYFPLFQIENNSSQALNINNPFITYFFYGFDGTVHLEGYKKMAWHNMPISEKKMQVLPGIFRKFPYTYSKWKKNLFRLYNFFKRK